MAQDHGKNTDPGGDYKNHRRQKKAQARHAG